MAARVVVLGGGVAGMSAAQALVTRGFEVVVPTDLTPHDFAHFGGRIWQIMTSGWERRLIDETARS